MLSYKKDEINGDKKTAKNKFPFFLRLFESLSNFFKQFSSKSLKNRSSKQVPQLEDLIKTLEKFSIGNASSKLLNNFILMPLIREGQCLNDKKITSLEISSLGNYITWIEKANRWIRLLQNNDEQEIQKNVRFIIIQCVHKTIMKDMKLLKEYRDFQLETLRLSADENNMLLAKIGKETYLKLKGLNQLYLALSHSHSENEILLYKQKINEEREKVFESCLSIIDKNIEQEFPLHTINNVNEEIANIIDEIIKLENKVLEIQETLKENKSLKRSDKSKINFLYQKAYSLSLDIRLTEEMFDRIENSLKLIRKIHANSK